MMSLIRPARRHGNKFYGRQIIISHEDGQIETHLLPPTAFKRNLSKAQISFDQWEGECLCQKWRSYCWGHVKRLQLIRALKLYALGMKRMYWDGKMR